MISKSSKILVAMAAIFASNSAMASGYGVKLQSGYTAGMANAGSGVSDDALAIYANPAAMIQATTHQIAGHFTGVFGNTKFRGRNSTTGVVAPNGALVPGAINETGSTRNAAKKVAVPSFGVIANAHDRLKVGVMVHAPFGLKFNYGNNSITRAHSTRAEMTTINILPSFALKIIDSLAFGAGLQMQYSKVELARKYSLTNTNIPTTVTGSTYTNIGGRDWSMGWTAGLYAKLSNAWKVGFSYKSKMIANLDGNGEAVVGGNPVSTFKAEAKVRYPHIFTLSSSYDINCAWTVLADVIYTRWDAVKDISIRSHLSTGQSTDVIPLNWKNSWFFAAGVNYRLNDSLSFRFGYAYDMAPSRTATRVASIPDSNKHWIATGATYNVSKAASLTISYGHEFFQKGKINLQPGAQTAANAGTFNKGALVGKVHNSVDLVSVQFNYKF